MGQIHCTAALLCEMSLGASKAEEAAIRRNMLRLCALLRALLRALSLGTGRAEEAVNLLAVDHLLYELGYRDDACAEAIS